MGVSGTNAITLPCVPRSVRIARRHAAAWLADVAPTEAVETAVLIVSELTTNAVCHGGTEFTLRLQVDGATCRVEVEDNGRTTSTPVAEVAPADAERGRGLAIVSALGPLGQALTGEGTLAWSELSWTPEA